MRLACPYQLSPTQNMLGNGAQLSARNAAGGYLPSDNPASLKLWCRFGVGVSESGGFASAWADQSGNGNDLLQATGTNQPAYSAGILTFDGVDNFMKCVAFTLNQPCTVAMLISPITWTDNEYIWDGNTADSTSCFQGGVPTPVSPEIACAAGATVGRNSYLTLASYHALTALYSGLSSSVLVDTNAVITGNGGTNNAAGFTIGRAPGFSGTSSNIAVKEIIIRNVNDATIRQDDHDYLLTL